MEHFSGFETDFFTLGYTVKPVSSVGELQLTQTNDATNDSFSKQLFISNCFSPFLYRSKINQY